MIKLTLISTKKYDPINDLFIQHFSIFKKLSKSSCKYRFNLASGEAKLIDKCWHKCFDKYSRS